MPLRLGGFDPVEQLCFLMCRLSEAREDGDVSPRCARPMSCFGPVRVFRTGLFFPFFSFWISLHLAAGEDPLGLKPNVHPGGRGHAGGEGEGSSRDALCVDVRVLGDDGRGSRAGVLLGPPLQGEDAPGMLPPPHPGGWGSTGRPCLLLPGLLGPTVGACVFCPGLDKIEPMHAIWCEYTCSQYLVRVYSHLF